MKARVLETPLTFTTEAQARNDAAMAQAESAINIMIYVTRYPNSTPFPFYLGVSLLKLNRGYWGT